MQAIVKDDLKKEEKKNIVTASERPPNRFRLYYCPFWYPFYCRLQQRFAVLDEASELGQSIGSTS
jgi:hypothetical protein